MFQISRIGRLQQEGTPQQMMTNNNWKYRIPCFGNQVTRRLTVDMSSVQTFPRILASQISNKCHQIYEMGGIPEEPNHCSLNRWREDVVRGQKWRGQAQETFVVSFLSQNRMPEGEGSKQREV